MPKRIVNAARISAIQNAVSAPSGAAGAVWGTVSTTGGAGTGTGTGAGGPAMYSCTTVSSPAMKALLAWKLPVT